MRATRKELENAIERAIGALDAFDGDTDLEPEEDCGRDESDFAGMDGARDPALMVDAEPGGDDEPSLGSVCCVGYCGPIGNAMPGAFGQERWSDGNRRDLEDEHDGREPDADDERSAQAAHTPLVHVDSLEYGWSQGERVKLEPPPGGVA